MRPLSRYEIPSDWMFLKGECDLTIVRGDFWLFSDLTTNHIAGYKAPIVFIFASQSRSYVVVCLLYQKFCFLTG